MKQSTNKPRIASKAQASQEVLSFVSQPEHALTLLGMLTQAQLSIKDLLGQISKCFIEQLLVLSAQQVGGTKSTPLAMSAMCAGTAPTALSSALARPKLKVKHSDAAASMLEGLEQMFTAATLGVQGTLACSLSNPNSPTRWCVAAASGVTHYHNADMALRWTVIGFLESERGCAPSRALPSCQTSSEHCVLSKSNAWQHHDPRLPAQIFN